ncbi:MAG: TRAP transporter small permease [Rhodobacteraceae bacterium]|nr:TRAP transporter small permease [Paracoccaceae bacterium]
MNRALTLIARILALLGGFVLIALVLTTTFSIIGRSLNTIGHSDVMENIGWLGGLLRSFGPINGDYELVEAGVAIAIFAFLPWCQLSRTHATVDVFTNFLGRRVNALLSLIWEIMLTAILFVVTWRISIGTSEKMRYGETTFLLQMPVWWPYAICTVIAGIAAVVGLYVVWQRLAELFAKERPDAA